MKHLSEKELITFAGEKKSTIEKHLNECSKCLKKYDFLSMKLRMNSYVEYERALGDRTSRDCLSKKELEAYASGRISKEEKESIKKHLICCEKCADACFNLDTIKAKSLWRSVEEAVSFAADRIKGIFILPDLAASRGTVLEKSDVIRTFIGDEVKVEIPIDKDGYLTVIHWNGENISLVFPNLYEKDAFVRGEKVKLMRGKIDPPAGMQELRVFLTEENLINIENINFNDENSVLKEIDSFIKKLMTLDENRWSQKEQAYEVMEFGG